MSTISNTLVNHRISPETPLLLSNGAAAEGAKGDELKEAFTDFVGQTFFGQMMKAMRSTVGKAAYFDGGRAEEIFRGQLDQTLAEHMTKASAKQFAEPMFEQQFPRLSKQEPPMEPMAGLNQLVRR